MTDEQMEGWMETRRKEYRARALPTWKINRLNGISRWRWGRITTPVTEHLAFAEELARQNGGCLPPMIKLKREGHHKLVDAIHRNPSLFTQLNQIRLKTANMSDSDYVALAERIAKSNDGALPSGSQLSRNGHSGLAKWLIKNKSSVAHLQLSGSDLATKYVTRVRELVRNNGGVLPKVSVLIKEHHALYTYMYRHPEAFPVFKSGSPKRWAVQEHVAHADSLAFTHEGVLPNVGWLQKNGHTALEFAIRKYPSAFTHLPQEIRNRMGNLIGFRNGTPTQRCALEIKHGLRLVKEKRVA